MEKKLKHKEVIKIIKRNEIEEFVTKLQESLKKNSENLIIFSIIILIVLIAIPLYINNKKSKELKAGNLLSNADYYLTRAVMPDVKDASMYGYFKSKEEKYDKIIAIYMEILQNYKGTSVIPYAYLAIGNTYYNANKYKEALEYYNTFIEKYKKHQFLPDALNGRAFTNYQIGNIREAISDWEKSLELSKEGPFYYEAKFHLGLAYQKSNETEKARKIFEEIINENKNSYWALNSKEWLAKN